MGVFTSNFTFVPFLALLTYSLLGNKVTPQKAFFAVAVFNVMTEVMMYYVPNAAACLGELLASVKRIQVCGLMQGPYSDQNKLLLYQVWQYFNTQAKYFEILKGGSIEGREGVCLITIGTLG